MTAFARELLFAGPAAAPYCPLADRPPGPPRHLLGPGALSRRPARLRHHAPAPARLAGVAAPEVVRLARPGDAAESVWEPGSGAGRLCRGLRAPAAP